MISLLVASVLVSRSQADSGSPIVVPIELFYGDPVIKLSIDGKPPADFGLNMTTRHSIVVDKDDAGLARKLSFDGKTLGTELLEAPAANVHPVLNALGLGVLDTMAVGMDYGKNQITFWPGGRISPEAASAWILKAAKWGAESKVWQIPIERRAGVAPVIPINVGGKKMFLLLRIGQQGTSFARGEEPAGGTPVEYGQGGNHAILTNVGVGPQTLPWILYFRGVSYDPRKEIDPSIVGTFTTENLLARRVLVDLVANVMYVEALTPDEQLSMFLTEWLQLPAEVEGAKVLLREMPGTKFFPQLAPIYESEVLEVMGQPIDKILAAARAPNPDNMAFLRVLFEKVWQGYKLKFKRPNGTVQEATLSPPRQ